MKTDYDFIIIGSGFGGSVAALRLSEKGYRVLVIEKGKRLGSQDFPKSNWNLRKWLWLPSLRFFGLFKLTFFRHVTILTGVGVGGGSLVYANTLPVPRKDFFESESWSQLADWESELRPFYKLARKMLGTAVNPRLEIGDKALQVLACDLNKESSFSPTTVAVFFGEPGKTVPDPYFDGKGPERTGCTFCGGCMLGCRFNAKNSLDKNYLHLAEQMGCEIKPESEVMDVQPAGAGDGTDGYVVRWKSSTSFIKSNGMVRARGIIFAGGVLGTVPLLLRLKKKSLTRLSDMVGKRIRTNSESLLGVTTFDKKNVFSDGIAIGSILHTDEHSHLEPVRYSAGSGFWRIFGAPMAFGKSLLVRLYRSAAGFLKEPIRTTRAYFVSDWSKYTQILLFMQTINSTLQFRNGLFGVKSQMEEGPAPSAFVPEAGELAEKYAKIVGGKPMALLTETILGIPTTAHILGGCVMGRNSHEGVIDKDNRVFEYEKMYVCDGSMISANPGVNPSLTITALSERAMSKIPPKESQ